MIIYNVKVNKRLILKSVLLLMLIICITLGAIGIYNICKNINQNKEYNLIDDSIPSSEYALISKENYTNILQQVHNNIDTYVGQKIAFSGYVYRVKNFSDDQFVLARDMDIGNNQTLIVGFLCSCENISDYPSYTWINIKGEIIKGTYNNVDTPMIKVTSIEKTSKPENANVPLPDDEYVPTAVIY
jgi:uncharacterized membrane protein YcgQ (UPF0703/DUF1980 family)